MSTAETLTPAEVEALRTTPALKKLAVEEQRADIERYKAEAAARADAKERANEGTDIYLKLQRAYLDAAETFIEAARSYAAISRQKREDYRRARNLGLGVSEIGIEPADLGIRAANEKAISNVLVDLVSASRVR